MIYTVVISASARRALTHELPESVAAACFEFIRGALADNPQRVGKPLGGKLEGRYAARRGEFRIFYLIDDGRVVVTVVKIQHRRDVYRR